MFPGQPDHGSVAGEGTGRQLLVDFWVPMRGMSPVEASEQQHSTGGGAAAPELS